MQIVEGHAIIAYDFKVHRGQSKCLFNMKESLEQKKERIAKNSLDLSADGVKNLIDKLHGHAADQAKKIIGDIPGLALPKELLDFKPE